MPSLDAALDPSIVVQVELPAMEEAPRAGGGQWGSDLPELPLLAGVVLREATRKGR